MGKGKNEGGKKKGTFPLNTSEATWLLGVETMLACLYVYTSIIESSDLQSEHRSPIFRGQVLIAHCGSHKLL